MNSTEARVALVTGASSGIGLAAANALLDAGYTVYGLSRHPFPGARHTHLVADVTDEAQVRAAVDAVLAREGRIDLLVNNAGFGISGAVEFTDYAAARRQFDVNLFGTLHCIRAVAPHMRARHGGTILNGGSVAGAIPIPFQAFYSAAKAAVASVTMALQNELRPFSVNVCALLPGDVRTGFTAAREKNAAGPTGARPLCPGICPFLRADAAVSMSYTGRMSVISLPSFCIPQYSRKRRVWQWCLFALPFVKGRRKCLSSGRIRI